MKILTTYPPQFVYGTEKTIVVNFLFWGGIILLYTFREIPIIGKIWNVVKIFLLVLLATLALGFVKEKFKDFFKEK